MQHTQEKTTPVWRPFLRHGEAPLLIKTLCKQGRVSPKSMSQQTLMGLASLSLRYKVLINDLVHG